MSPVTTSETDYRDLVSSSSDFDPTNYEETIAAFCARTVVLDTLGTQMAAAITGTPQIAAGVQAVHAAGLECHPVDVLLFTAGILDEDAETPTSRDLVSFTRSFAGVSPSLRLGALLTHGLTAPVPGFSGVNVADLSERLTQAWDTQRTLGLHLENLASLPQPYTLLRALRMLLVEQTPAAAAVAAGLARPHITWCLQAYQAALRLAS
ncbi:hypothetical protein [Corynebacterium sp. AOP12-C2-36]|uniref:hypothetical protein n=1 Tax=Corynebacterium sp. AOP12-C2-36 TaxID=3457723 RepID=UPI0040346DD0